MTRHDENHFENCLDLSVHRNKNICPITWSKAMSEGGYEPSQVPEGFTSGDGEKLIEEMVRLAETIK